VPPLLNKYCYLHIFINMAALKQDYILNADVSSLWSGPVVPILLSSAEHNASRNAMI
jgi:hypothetical protein